MSKVALGERRCAFKPARVDLNARKIVGIGLIATGILFSVYCIYAVIASGGNLPLTTVKGQKGWSWVQLAIIIGLGVGFIVSGVLLIRYARSLSKFRIVLYQEGFVVIKADEKKAYRWEEILVVNERHIYQRPLFLRGSWMPEVLRKSFIVTMYDGGDLQFDCDIIKKPLRLAQLIKEETDQRSIPWIIADEHN